MSTRPTQYVTGEALRAYIQAFHATVDEISSQFFALDQRKKLVPVARLPAKVISYVSKQFGVAFEYVPAATTSFETKVGSARVEDLVVNLPRRLRGIGPLLRIDGHNISLIGLRLEGGVTFLLESGNADVTLSAMKFTDERTGWSREIKYLEVYGDRRAERWTVASAQSRAKDVVLQALLTTRRAKTKGQTLHAYATAFHDRTVLLLGSYDDAGLARLARIKEALVSRGYDAILVRDVPEFEHYDLGQKVAAVGAMCRFVVIDDTEASGHLNEFEICRTNRWVVALLHAEGHRASFMTVAVSGTSNVMEEFDYEPKDPTKGVNKAADWAEERLSDVRSKLNRAYPWRDTSE